MDVTIFFFVQKGFSFIDSTQIPEHSKALSHEPKYLLAASWRAGAVVALPVTSSKNLVVFLERSRQMLETVRGYSSLFNLLIDSMINVFVQNLLYADLWGSRSLALRAEFHEPKK